jgi:hypothetical protein
LKGIPFSGTVPKNGDTVQVDYVLGNPIAVTTDTGNNNSGTVVATHAPVVIASAAPPNASTEPPPSTSRQGNLFFRGEWAMDVDYLTNDVVVVSDIYGDIFYLCIADHINEIPENESFWIVFGGGATNGGSVTPGGDNDSIQYNNAGGLGGASDFKYDATIKAIRMGLEVLGFDSSLTTLNSLIQVGNGDSQGNYQFIFSDDAEDSGFDTAFRAGGTQSAPTPVVDGMVFKRWRGRGWKTSGENVTNSSSTQVMILLRAAGNWSATEHPTQIEFWTTDAGSTVNTLRLTITKEGNLNIPSGHQYQVNGAQHTHVAADISGIREVLSAARTYYVRTDGSDSNNGLTNTSGGAFLTIQKAVDVAAALDTLIYDVDILLADGSYPETVNCKNTVGAGKISIKGNNATPANVTVTRFYKWDTGTTYSIEDLKLTGASGIGIEVSGGAKMTYSNVNFGGTFIYQLASLFGALLVCMGNYSISAGAFAHMTARAGGGIQVQSKRITLTGTPAFATTGSGGFLECRYGSTVFINGNTFSGAATGRRYYVDMNGVIQTAGGGPNYLPGNAAGAVGAVPGVYA